MKFLFRLVVLLISGGFLASCAGMTASYSSPVQVSSPQITVIPITSQLVIQQNSKLLSAESGVAINRRPPDAQYQYKIMPADVLTISVPTIVSMNSGTSASILGDQGEGYVVYDDGSIYLPFAGSITVIGLTLREVQERVVKALSKFLRSPEVVVTVKEYRSQRALITGQVQRPGYLPITDVPQTLVGVLSATGGIIASRGLQDPRLVGSNQGNQSAAEHPDLTRVIVRRDGVDIRIDVTKILRGGDISQDITLKDGDVVIVPATRRGSVIVMGEILRPALYEIEIQQANLAQLLMSAGGLNSLTAKASSIYVIRGDFSQPVVYQLNAKSPDSMLLAQKFSIQSEDVIFVAETNVSRWNKVLQQILPTVQGLLSTAVIANTVDDLQE